MGGKGDGGEGGGGAEVSREKGRKLLPKMKFNNKFYKSKYNKDDNIHKSEALKR